MLADRVRMANKNENIIYIPAPIVVEDFNQANVLNKFVRNPYNQLPQLTADAYEGLHALLLENISTLEEPTGLYSLTGHMYYPSKGYRFSFYAKESSKTQGRGADVFFGLQNDSSNYKYSGYVLHIGSSSEARASEFSVRNNGVETLLASNTTLVALVGSEAYYKVTVDWYKDGRIIVYNYDMQEVFSVVDNTFDTGGIGFLVERVKNTDVAVYFDYLRIEGRL